MRPTITIILLAFLVPATAQAGWHAPVAIPVPAPQYDTPAAAMAIDDNGRAVVAFPSGTAATLGVLAPGARAITAVPLPGVQRPAALAFAPDGSVVGIATTQTGESPGGEEWRRGPCCDRPTVIRWRPGTAPELTAVAPQRHDDYLLGDLAVDSAATAFFIAHREADAASSGVDVLARVPLRGPVSFRRITSPRDVDADSLALAPDGRLVQTFERRGRLWLRVESRRPDRDLGAIGKDEAWATDVGDDGTVAVAHVHRKRLSVRTIRGGRLGRPRDLGPAGSSFALAIDASGGVHVAWRRPGRGVAVVAPAGRRTFAGVTLESLMTSPDGATAVELRAGDRITVATGTRG